MTLEEAQAFVEEKGVVLESARGIVPNLAEAIAGEPIAGRWWGHPKGHRIFGLLRAVRASSEVLVCRLVDGKVTFVHRRLWPALVCVAEILGADRLMQIREVHTSEGRHEVEETPFPRWVPRWVFEEAERLTEEEARDALGAVLPEAGGK